ncbi:MAG TPA: dihydropyrimidinase [Thermomicrobiales bacterium]|nr:dihydropyrimidinase [Thermomicrobiales bacterium]
MTQLDLVIRGGTVVTAGAEMRADVGIAGEVVVQIGGEMSAVREIDATGRLLLPGGIDAHVHLTNPPGSDRDPRWVDDFTSGSAAALAGGITTLGNMTFLDRGELPLVGLERESAYAREESVADWFLHPVLNDTSQPVLDEIPQLLEAGCNSIKYFMSMAQFDQQVGGYLAATRTAGEQGLITLIHCEDHALIGDATARLMAAGKSSLRYYAESRPVVSEVVATQRAIAFAEATGAPVYVVHLSSRRALEACAEAQARGVPVYVETRPLYLHLTRERFEEDEGAKYVGQPPLRDQEDVDALWEGIRQGVLHTVCTDHAPWTLEAKLDPALSVANLRPGVENLQTMLPMLWSEGVRAGRISRSRFVEGTATNAAKLFGLYPRKGTIAVGSDADIVVFDPERTRTVERSMLKSNAGYSPYEGWQVTGWPDLTLRRGEGVAQGDEMLGAAGSGQLARRGPAQAL